MNVFCTSHACGTAIALQNKIQKQITYTYVYVDMQYDLQNFVAAILFYYTDNFY